MEKEVRGLLLIAQVKGKKRVWKEKSHISSCLSHMERLAGENLRTMFVGSSQKYLQQSTISLSQRATALLRLSRN